MRLAMVSSALVALVSVTVLLEPVAGFAGSNVLLPLRVRCSLVLSFTLQDDCLSKGYSSACMWARFPQGIVLIEGFVHWVLT